MLKRTIIENLPWANIDKKIYKNYIKSKKAYKKGKIQLSNYYFYRIVKRYGCYISPKAEIGKNLKLPHPTGVVIGEGVKIGTNCTIYQNVTLGRKSIEKAEYPIIEDNVIIYCNSVIIGNVKIGKNSIIGCNTTILKSVEANSKCTGVVK